LLQGVTQRYQPNVMMTKLPSINCCFAAQPRQGIALEENSSAAQLTAADGILLLTIDVRMGQIKLRRAYARERIDHS
jgi:hypothetical protein